MKRKQQQVQREFIDQTLKIYRVAKENPRRSGSLGFRNWKLYRNGQTVEQYMQNTKADMGHVRWDVRHGYIKLASR